MLFLLIMFTAITRVVQNYKHLLDILKFIVVTVRNEDPLRLPRTSERYWRIKHNAKPTCYNLLKTQSLIQYNSNDQLRAFAYC